MSDKTDAPQNRERRYVYFRDSMPSHPALVGAGPMASMLWFQSVALLSRLGRADARVPKSAVDELLPAEDRRAVKRAAKKLVSVGMWVDEGDCWHIVGEGLLFRLEEP